MYTKAFLVAALASCALGAPAATTNSPGEACRVACIQSAVNSGNSPNFADCAASSASCAASATSTAAPTSTPTSPGEACRVACIQSAINSGNSPNFAVCAASSASCAASATATAAPTSTSTSPGEACRVACIQSAVNSGNSPNFAVCAASSASCAGAMPVTATATVAAQQTTAAAVPAGAQPQLAQGATGWTVENLIRYCSADGSGCDYNFDINYNDNSALQHCTIIRMAGNGPTESWYDLPCGSDAGGKAVKVSWGYATNPGPPFAVMTLVNSQSKSLAYFGVSNVNEQPVTPSSPYGSGHYANIGPQPIYTF